MEARRFLLLLLLAGCGPTPAQPAHGPAPAPLSGSSTPPAIHPSVAGKVVWVPQTTRSVSGVVYVEDAPKQGGVATTADIAIKNKELTPFIAVLTTGGTATFSNRDALTHHVFSPELPGWDTGYLAKDQTTTKRFDPPGAYSLLCNIHPEMLSYLVVVPSSSFGTIGRDGRYTIGDLAPGTYRVTAWGPRMQPMTQSVTVGSSGPTVVDFELHPASGRP